MTDQCSNTQLANNFNNYLGKLRPWDQLQSKFCFVLLDIVEMRLKIISYNMNQSCTNKILSFFDQINAKKQFIDVY